MQIAYIAPQEPLPKKKTKKQEELEFAYLLAERLQPAARRLANRLLDSNRELHGDDWLKGMQP